MSRESSDLEGWVPELDGKMALERVIDLAFDYRGNTTIVKTDGSEMVAYVFNRDKEAQEPFIQVYDQQGDGPFTIPYAEIETIRFTGKDTAAGQSWEAWGKRREAQKAKQAARSPNREQLGAA